VTGILSALRERDRAGSGQEVGVNLLHTGLYIAGNDASLVASTEQDALRHDPVRPRNPLWAHYPTADERWIFLVMIDSQRYWPAVCRAIGRPELEHDERFADERSRYRSSKELTALLAEIFASRTLADWERLLVGQPIIWSPVRSLLEATRDPQVTEMGVLADVAHPEAEGLRTVAPPIELSAHPMPGTRPAPVLGADGEAVLRAAGCSSEEISAALATER
jgi:formyl-CoA transferase